MRTRLSAPGVVAAALLLAGCGPSREQTCKILDTSYELQRIHTEAALLKGDFAEGRDKVGSVAEETAAVEVRHDDLRQIRDRLAHGFRAVASALARREAADTSDDRARRRELDAQIADRRAEVAAIRSELTSLCAKR